MNNCVTRRMTLVFLLTASLACRVDLAAQDATSAVKKTVTLDAPDDVRDASKIDLSGVPEAYRQDFAAMGEAVEASAKVFDKLSTAQMNFRPGDGSHTPRWNAEHLRAAQLRFFTAIYHAIDGDVEAVTEGPKQMPDQYKAAHADWTGSQEADAMRAAHAKIVSHAGLLSDLQPDAKPPATFWPSTKALLNVMVGHFAEHTGNVEKKFNDPNWPAE